MTLWPFEKIKPKYVKAHPEPHNFNKNAEIQERHQQATEEWDDQRRAIQYADVELKVASQTSLQTRIQEIV